MLMRRAAEQLKQQHWMAIAIDLVIVVLGVFLGSALWWLGLSTMVSSVRHKLSAKTMQSINRLSGAILLGFAVYQLSTLLPR